MGGLRLKPVHGELLLMPRLASDIDHDRLQRFQPSSGVENSESKFDRYNGWLAARSALLSVSWWSGGQLGGPPAENDQ